MVVAKKSRFKGYPVLEIRWMEDDPYPMKFGMKKAELIVEAIDEIKKFVEENKEEEWRNDHSVN